MEWVNQLTVRLNELFGTDLIPYDIHEELEISKERIRQSLERVEERRRKTMNKQEIPLGEMLAYSTHQAAAVLSLCERTVRNMAHRGDLAHVRVGKRILIPKTAVENFLKESVQQ
jgi:excisionase family DNA binding protein